VLLRRVNMFTAGLQIVFCGIMYMYGFVMRNSVKLIHLGLQSGIQSTASHTQVLCVTRGTGQ
jgi:hypothetical protein